MIESVVVENFQSLVRAQLDLGKFTVVIGPSNSGKSALIRALRVLARNSQGASFVTNGRKTTTIQANLDRGAVQIERGPSVSNYMVAVDYGPEEVYTKCGKDTPPFIREFIRFLELDDELINIAGQFDPPFLLTATGTKVAKILGDLTNINVIFDAIKEANRRRLAANSELRVRTSDLVQLREKAQQFATLPGRIKALEETKHEYETMVGKHASAENLKLLIETTETLAVHRVRLKAAHAELPTIDFASSEQAIQRSGALGVLLRTAESDAAKVTTLRSEIEQLDEALSEVDKTYHEILKESGQCPLCGQKIA